MVALYLLLLLQQCLALRYDPAQVGYNLNENQNAIEPKDYSGKWENHTYNPSPENWRMPFYVLTIDRFVDGDPTNNDANNTVFEHHWMSNQFRFGGDVAGIMSDLDYVQGLGGYFDGSETDTVLAKAIYFTGSMMINMPWSADGYGPLDFTLLDRHHGHIEEWRALTTEIHRRGMYIILDHTMATMGNLLAFAAPYTNTSVPFSFDEHDYTWKDPERRYHDFQPGDARNESCVMPAIWEQNGYQAKADVMEQYHGCRDSEFDLYGDIKGTGSYPSYINQFSRFASVQDRLREWRPDVMEKINVMACMQITMLDIDGFRMDKAVQTTVDAMATFSSYQRACAKELGKDNFLMVGEVVGDPKLASVYFGRGKQPDQALSIAADAVHTNNATEADNFIRPFGHTALDGAAFQYDVYGSMTRFLGLDGPWGSLGVDWVEMWNDMLSMNDLVNANTGLFDPRHMFGMTNQDVFRWPALANGTQRQLLGFFVTILELPGIPMILFGEEQEHYVLENLAPDYLFGRTPMASSSGWQAHGCYQLGEEVYVDMPFEKSFEGCHDDSVSRDHRDPSKPIRNILKRMLELREQYPVLNDGFNLTTLSTRTYDLHLRGSGNLPSPHGIWSVYRGRNTLVQDFTAGHGNQPVWLLFHNENTTKTYNFDCDSLNISSSDGVLVSAFPGDTSVKNLFYPYEEYTLASAKFSLGFENSTENQGCLPSIVMRPWEFKAFVPTSEWEQPRPVITEVVPGHDARLRSTVASGQTESINVTIGFSMAMDCDSITKSLTINSTTQTGAVAKLDTSSVSCGLVTAANPSYVAETPTLWEYTATFNNVAHGIHTYTLNNPSDFNGSKSTNTTDKFMFRVGQTNNPMVFPTLANFTAGLLQKDASGNLYVAQTAAGADKVRYSTNWGSSFSDWTTYTGENMTLVKQSWSGTDDQKWDGEHVILHYWSRMTGSSDHVQHSDLRTGDHPVRRWPHAWVVGAWNKWGSDAGLKNQMSQNSAGNWTFDLFDEWPSMIMINIWGINPDGNLDKSAAYGDVDQDGVLDWLPPDSLAENTVNISSAPPRAYLGYRLLVNDGTYRYTLVPHGSSAIQAIAIALLCILPLLTAVLGVRAFMASFYKVKFNRIGAETEGKGFLQKSGLYAVLPAFLSRRSESLDEKARAASPNANRDMAIASGLAADAGSPARRKVVMATMEYEIEDWAIKIKIGGLGVMSSLMAKQATHQDLIWVVPCIGDVEYPFEDGSNAQCIEVTLLGQVYEVAVYYHVLNNITYVLLDAPVFRKRTKADPYPARMDDLESGVYYSTWNQCIAETIRRFQPDIYHINDYHGAAAPLYLLPAVIPCCLSLHNAEFQGMWPLRTGGEMDDICQIFNLQKEVVKKYIQFGEVFNLLHAGATYLHWHQAGFGAVGVSKKYGKRSLARYPIFWCLDKIGSLPNPDPTDTAPWDKNLKRASVHIDHAEEEKRPAYRQQAQEWAGLTVDPKAELFIFVGRWSQQKGIDLIADTFPSILTKNPAAQLICVGPVIDLHGKFAALKLEKLMIQFPGRVYSAPKFTALPPYIFSGAEFALMPSRDEPFGLVAVEFGRKGALCVGSRVGGFGHMPGWWFTVESMTPKHLLEQFRSAIDAALASDYETRAMMRAYSVVQRFPVAQWIEGLEELYSTSIKKSERVAKNPGTGLQNLVNNASSGNLSNITGFRTARPSAVPSAASTRPTSPMMSASNSVMDLNSMPNSPTISRPVSPNGGAGLQIPDASRPRTQRSVTPAFSDSKGKYFERLSMQLDTIDLKSAKDSRRDTIDDYIVSSEKDWFNKYHTASLKRDWSSSSTAVLDEPGKEMSRRESLSEYRDILGEDYEVPDRLKRLLARKIGTWNVYCFLLAFGQLASISSLQLTLLTGAQGESAPQLYTLCSIYLAASLCFWILYRRAQSIWVLSAPFGFFGLALIFLAASVYVDDYVIKGWLHNVCSGLYSFGSAAGSFYFSLNFGTEGGTPTQVWAWRAVVITGTQQLFITFLWGLGVSIGRGDALTSNPSPKVILPICILLAALFLGIGIVLFLGLPDYYRQKPGVVPSFYRAMFKKGIANWFWLMVVLQGYWLSTNYGRNWTFLWSSKVAPIWALILLILFFFVIVWATSLFILGRLSKSHTWIIPIFAIALGAPGWCQMLWGISGLGNHIPWAGPIAGALLSRGIWLWLGTLAALQNVGFGMILLMTLTRFHLIFVFIVSQIIGAFVTILARLTAPDKIGPGDVFPNLAAGAPKAVFWVALVCQLVICVGYFKFFRKAQLSKP